MPTNLFRNAAITALLVTSALSQANFPKYKALLLGSSSFGETYSWAITHDSSGWTVAGSGELKPPNGTVFHAIIWPSITDRTPKEPQPTDVNPFLLNDGGSSEIYGISGSLAVGYGNGAPTGGLNHAYIWQKRTPGNAWTSRDINPAGYARSVAQAISGDLIVGYAVPSSGEYAQHAMIWDAKHPDRYLDLNGSPGMQSTAYAVDGETVGGYIYQYEPKYGVSGTDWNVAGPTQRENINPQTFYDSEVHGISGPWQVGNGSLTNSGPPLHALAWYAPPNRRATWFDLTPPNVNNVEATAVAGNLAVGWGQGPGLNAFDDQALMWDLNTREMFILGKIKGAGYYSNATCIEAATKAVAGYGFSEQGTDAFQGILWIPI